MRDEGCDDAIGVLGNTGGRYQNTTIRSQHFNAPRSTFNNVEGTQNNIVNVNVNNTVEDDSTSHLRPSMTSSYDFVGLFREQT